MFFFSEYRTLKFVQYFFEKVLAAGNLLFLHVDKNSVKCLEYFIIVMVASRNSKINLKLIF